MKMIFKPNLPVNMISKAVASADITPKMQKTLIDFGIEPLFLKGIWNCDVAVRNHPDIYLAHLNENNIFLGCNICSINGELDCDKINVNEVLICDSDYIKYENEVKFNCAVIGEDIICNSSLILPEILEFAKNTGKRVIDVKQGYAKCNICIVDENSIITEDKGIYKKLSEFGYNVLLLENHYVKLQGHEYGFIGGASGKISSNKLAFFGDVSKHPEYNRIYDFLKERDVEPVSLSDELLTDFGSLLPIA